MAERIIVPQQSHHEATIHILSSLIAGSMAGRDAIEQLEMLHAEKWLVDSVRQIEAMFREDDPSEWYGPLGEVVRKVQGAA